jgi:Zn-dependent protease
VTTLISCLLVIVLHELAHAAAALAHGLRIKRIGLSWKGLYIVREAGSPLVNAQVSLAGPLANLAFALFWPLAPHFALYNLLFGLVNLAPVRDSDGQRALAALKAAKLSRSRAAE